MENHLQNVGNPVMMIPSRTPLSENLPAGEHACQKTEGKYESSTSGFQTKARALFADPGILNRGENGCPTSTKARQYLHGTPPRTRKNAGKQPPLTTHTEASGCDLASAPSVSFSQHRKTSYSANLSRHHIRQPFEHFVLEQDNDFWKDHNVQVLIRIRPLNSAETAADGTSTCLRQESSQALTWLGQPESRFTFDHVACASTTQEELFQVAGLPMVDNCIEGYNSSMFAYGQTGSGKTYTMLGEIEAMNHKLNPNCGMTPRLFEYLFTKIDKEEAAHRQKHLTFTCKCSFLEIYNEQITDLLEPTSTNLQIHDNPRKGVFVENLKEIQVQNVGDVMELLLQGAANRRVAQTRMNQESSRSHSVFTCVIESQWVTDSVTSFRYGRLNLVDLAGSERQKVSGAEGERVREAANINKSLSTLGLVIMILVDLAQGKQRHVPYRDSKLTFLLQDSLGGNSKTAIIATVSPAISCANETLSTLKFAQRAKFIQNNAVINEDASGDVKVLQSQIQDLKRELEKLREQTQLSISSPLMVMKKTKINGAGKQTQTDFGVGFAGFKSSHKDQNLEKIQAMEELLAGSLSTEQEVLQEKNELAAENQQLNSLIQAYERDMNYVKTMLQLKEDKIQRLERVEDAIMSAEDYLQEDNRLLRQELHLLQDRMTKHPELLRFALENKHLIQQLRRYDEFYGGEREMLMTELANLRQQVLNLLQDNLTQAKQGRQMMPSTQDAGHDKEDNQTAHFESLLHRGKLVATADFKNCNNSDGFNEGTHTEVVSLLEEGNQALNEALQEVKSIHGSILTESETQPTNSSQENTVHSSDKVVKYSLQQLYDIAKDLQGRFKVLCGVAVGEKKQTKSESLKVLVPSWSDKRMKVKPDLITIIHASEYCKINENCSPAEHMNEVPVQRCSLPSLTKDKLKAREKRWLSEKMNLKHQLLRLQSDAVAKDKEIAALQNEEAILAAIVHKLHKEEEGMTEELINLKHQLEYSENQRLLGEQLYKRSLQENKEDKIKARLQLQKLVTELHNNNCMFMTVKKQMEIALASLREAEISRKNKKDTLECTGKDEKKVDSLEKELEQAYQSVDMQKELMMMETGMTSMLAVLEGRLQEAEDAWKGEKGMILLDLDRTNLDAAEKIGEASDASERFKHGQEIIREAELVVNALTKANEDAKIQKLSLMQQWHEERESMVTKIGELKSLIVKKEGELQMKAQEVQQMITKRESKMFLAHKEMNTNVSDSEERRNTTAVWKVSNKITNMPSSKQELLTAIIQPYNQLYVSKCDASVLANTTDTDSVRMLAEELDSNNLPFHNNNHLGLAHNDFREEKQKQVPATEIELMSFQNTKLDNMQACVSAELADQSKEVVKQKTEFDKSRYNMLQTQNSHVTTKLILQVQESELERKTWLQEARRQEYELDEAFDKANTDQMVLQKTTVEIQPALQSYDESTSLLHEKLEGIVATLSGKPGGEDAWVRFLNSFKHALATLEEDANSCLSFSNVICKKLDKTLAEKQSLEQELERKKELLKGSFFDLSLLQESTAEYINMKSEIDGAFSFIRSLQEEIDIKNERLVKKEIEYANLEREKMEATSRLLFLETSLSEAQKHITSEDALMKIVSLEASLEEKRRTIGNLELELLNGNFLAEQRMTHTVNSVKQELSLTLTEKEQLQTRLLTLEEQLDATQLAAETNKRLADEAQQIAEISKCQIREKEIEVKILEKSIHELEDTIYALENQMEILKREVELQQLSKEDLEMDLQALRHQQYHDPSCKIECSEDTKGQQVQIEIMTLRKEITDKSAEIKSLKLQVEELISAAEKQAVAHHQKLASLEAMADNLNLERGLLRQASPASRKVGDRSVASPFKCLSSGLAQQINFEMDEELYTNRCRIDVLEDLAASRQKEIFRLNKKLAEAETMTYDVIRDLLGVKSDIATHASYLDHEDLVRFSKMATRHTKKAINKEKELEALRDRYNEERASWLEVTGRRQAEVVAARIAVEKLRHKNFLRKAENKRLKADLSRQKKRLLQIQEKLIASSGRGKYHHHVRDIQHDDELHLNHGNDAQPSTTVDFER